MNPPNAPRTSQQNEDPLITFTTFDQLFEHCCPSGQAETTSSSSAAAATAPCSSSTPQHAVTDCSTPPRFTVGQEVFILDSSYNDPTGLSTYLVLSNYERDNAGRHLYRLIPCQNVAFRAAEARLLEIHYPLGAQVRRKGDAVASVITKRYVVRGQRLYDLRDEMGKRLLGVSEEELSAESGGSFAFVTPTPLEEAALMDWRDGMVG